MCILLELRLRIGRRVLGLCFRHLHFRLHVALLSLARVVALKCSSILSWNAIGLRL